MWVTVCVIGFTDQLQADLVEFLRVQRGATAVKLAHDGNLPNSRSFEAFEEPDESTDEGSDDSVREEAPGRVSSFFLVSRMMTYFCRAYWHM